jgi:hypothetical protein
MTKIRKVFNRKNENSHNTGKQFGGADKMSLLRDVC